MSRQTWRLIKESKSFYIRTYRSGLIALVLSSFINLFLSVALYYVYFDRPERDYYATSGVTPPILLTALDSPNHTSVPLLPDDDGIEEDAKLIPE